MGAMPRLQSRLFAAPDEVRTFPHGSAKVLKLDSTQVTKTYLRRLREWRAEAEGEAPH